MEKRVMVKREMEKEEEEEEKEAEEGKEVEEEKMELGLMVKARGLEEEERVVRTLRALNGRVPPSLLERVVEKVMEKEEEEEHLQ